ncbi:unnamed protein product, partial [Closterium sp. NIES-53]
AVEPVEVAVDSGAATGAEPAGAGSDGAGSGGAQAEGAEPGGAATGGAELGGAEPGGAATGGTELGGAATGGTEPEGAEPGGAGSTREASRGALSRREVLSPQELREWFARRWGRATGAGGTTATPCPGGAGAAGPGGPAEAAGVGPTGGSTGASGGTGAAGSAGPGAAGATGVGAAGGVGAGGSADAGTSEGAGAGGATGAGAPTGSPQGVVPLTRRLAETVDWPAEAPLSARRKRPSKARWAAQPDLLVQAALQESCAEVKRVKLVVALSSNVQKNPKSGHLRGRGEDLKVVNSLSLTEASSHVTRLEGRGRTRRSLHPEDPHATDDVRPRRGNLVDV